MVREAGVTLPDALRMASANPARSLGLTDRGLLRHGYYADVVLLDADLREDHGGQHSNPAGGWRDSPKAASVPRVTAKMVVSTATATELMWRRSRRPLTR